jgi:uncharacterized membrane protein SpoIIM required for sporulation
MAFGVLAQRLELVPGGQVAALVTSQVPAGQELVMGTPALFEFILVHNLLVIVVMAAFAPLTLGVLGGLLLTLNGFVIGYLGGTFFGLSELGYFACGTAPHGVLELLALVMAYAFALRVGASMVRPSPEGWLAGMRLALSDYGRGALVFVPLFAVAAFIEAFVTPAILRTC